MSISDSFYRWKYNLAKPGTIEFYRALKRQQYLSLDEIENLSWQKTRALLAYSYEHVPFYRDLFIRLGISPRDIKTPAEFEHFPILSRKELMANFERLLSDEYSLGDVNISTTGGSSGIPAKVCHQRNVPRVAMGWRVMDWWDISPAANAAEVYRNTASGFKARAIQFLQSFPGRQIQLDATSFSDDNIVRFLSRFRRFKPELLHGYVGAVTTVADYVIEHDICLPSPKAVWVTSAPLTPVQQKRIEKAFKAPVYDQYGCCEIYWLAAECRERKGLHMFYDCRRFEFVDSSGINVPNGEYGDIVITDLENYAFPLIRYANGDRARRLLTQCDCGCNLPLMDKVKGRTSDTFLLPSGTKVNGEFLTTLFDKYPDAVKQFQVYQHNDGSITLRLIPNDNCRERQAIYQNTVHSLENMVNYEVSVRLEIVSKIPLYKGKIRFVVSEFAAKQKGYER